MNGESLAEVLARMAAEAAERVPEADARAEKQRAELEAFKASIWRDRVFEATRSWVAKNAFASSTSTHAMRAVDKWLNDGCLASLVLRGGVGVGKTSAACLAVKRWLEPTVFYSDCGPRESHETSKLNVTWLRPDQLVSAVMHAYDETAPKLHRYVVIDDLGRETRAEFVECLCELFDRDGHTVLITTNMNKEQMRERYKKEPRLVDRFRDRCVAIDLPGDSLRKKNVDF